VGFVVSGGERAKKKATSKTLKERQDSRGNIMLFPTLPPPRLLTWVPSVK